MRRAIPGVVAFCVIGGIVFGRFADSAEPARFLVRPLLVTVVLAAAIGAAALGTGRFAVLVAIAAAAAVAAVSPWVVIGVCSLGVVLLIARMAERPIDLDGFATFAAIGFLVSGLVRVSPMVDWPMEAATASTDPGDTPVYLVLLDGYPRADTLADLGIDISLFLHDLAVRGFDHYPAATSPAGWTHHTMTAILGGVPSEDAFGTAAERRTARDSWRLPDGFAYIAPPVGHVTIPRTRDIGPGGVNKFEIDLLRHSIFGRSQQVGELFMDGLRDRLDASLDVLETTEETRVFAHLLAPHTPFLYDEEGESMPPPECWPECDPFDIDLGRLGISLDEWAAGTAGNLAYLNDRLIGVVDAILGRHPEAVIVLFSDHGGRWSADEPDEWRRSFLAARGVLLPRATPGGLLNEVP